MPNTSNDKILIATNNAGKVLELSRLLASSGFIVTTPNQENIQMDVEETGQTFEDNAAHDLESRRHFPISRETRRRTKRG